MQSFSALKDAVEEAARASNNWTGSRCPHIVFRGVFGDDAVAQLLTFAETRRADFRTTHVRYRDSDDLLVDTDIRSSLSLKDLGPLDAPFRSFVDQMSDLALRQFGMLERGLVAKEHMVQAYRDGDCFKRHGDTTELRHKVRILTCIYYFSRTPRPFTGGNLLLYGLPKFGGPPDEPQAAVTIEPERDSMIVFPSWINHEVTPVRIASGEWGDSRFTANCWLHRAGSV